MHFACLCWNAINNLMISATIFASKFLYNITPTGTDDFKNIFSCMRVPYIAITCRARIKLYSGDAAAIAPICSSFATFFTKERRQIRHCEFRAWLYRATAGCRVRCQYRLGPTIHNCYDFTLFASLRS